MKVWGIILIAVFVWALAGCGETPKPTKVAISPTGKKPEASPRPAAGPAAAPEGKVEPPPAVSYSYDPKGKPDPFRPLYVERVVKPAAKQIVETVAEGATPLERLDLTHLKLVALVWSITAPRAMVEDSAGKGYILTVGTSVGKHHGKVTQITALGLVVNERYTAPDGKMKYRDVPLKLYPD
jgi:type IV pilus assembly protein PilP